MVKSLRMRVDAIRHKKIEKNYFYKYRSSKESVFSNVKKAKIIYLRF